MAKTHISVIITIYNEVGSIDALILGLKKQTLIPDEVIVVDGGSSDQTYHRLLKHAKNWTRLKPYQISSNRSAGRNLAVKRSTGTILAFTDAGCIPHPTWLAELTKPFASSQTQVVSGYYRGQGETFFEKCLIPYVLVMPDRLGNTEFYPSTRSMALRRSVWNRTTGFNEQYNYSEDFAFAHELKKLGYSFTFAPKAVVDWLPGRNLSQAVKMFFNFALGDIRAGIFRPKVKNLIYRYATFMFLFFLGFEITWVFYPLLALILVYLIWSILKNYRYINNFMAIFWLPVIQIVSDISVISGTLVGFLSIMFKI